MINAYQHIIDVKNQSILAGRSYILTYMRCSLHSALQLAGWAPIRLHEFRRGAAWLSSITSASSRIGGRCTLHFCAVM